MSLVFDQLPELDLASPAYQQDPLSVVTRLRERAPLARSARGVEVLTYEGCAAVYNDLEMVTAIPIIGESMGLDLGKIQGRGRSLTTSEGEEHSALRSVVSTWFTPRRVRELRPAVIEWVSKRIEPISVRGAGDFDSEVAALLPATVFCWMMGADNSHADALYRMSRASLEFFTADPSKSHEIAAALREIESFVDALAAEKREKPGDDLMTILLAAADEGRASMTMEDSSSIALELLSASSDNTARSACQIVAQLATRPAVWKHLRAHPEAIPGAIEEVLRFDPVVEVDMHVAKVPRKIQGIEIPAGQIAWLNIDAANRDPSVYPDPDVFDATRKHERPQLNFGLGRHFCIGAALARMELEALLSVLTQSWVQLSLANPESWTGRRRRDSSPLSIEVRADV
jgi:cytochrome P450